MPDDQALSLQLPQPVAFGFPLGGINESMSREQQPPSASPDLLNVMPYDLTFRGRGGQRPGLAPASSTVYGGGTASAQVLLGLATEVTQVRTEYLVLVAGGKAYFGTSSASLAQIATTSSATTRGRYYPYWVGSSPYGSTSSSALLVSGTAQISGAAISGILYVVDGVTTTGYAIDFTVSPPVWTPANVVEGTAPFVNKPRIAAVYRKRLLLAGCVDDDPQNVFASRVGAPDDWDYAQPDPASAWSLNASTSGQIGDPVTALMPLSDDQLVIGCDRSLWLVSGDPADGGRVDRVAGAVGVLGKDAWDLSPDQDLYFVGTGGFYRMKRGTFLLENLSAAKYNRYFYNAAAAGFITIVRWDRQRHGAWIFRTATPKAASSHLWYDARNDGFFPIALPDVSGPTAGVEFAGKLVVGGWGAGGTSGTKLYSFDDTIGTDDGTAIASYAQIGPVRPVGPIQQSKIYTLDVVLGETPTGFGGGNFACNWTLKAGNTAYDALANSSQSNTGSFTVPGRQATIRSRMSATDFFVKLEGAGSGKTWSLDEAVARFGPAGRVRS